MNRVDMMDALTGFDAANRQGLVETQPTKTDPNVLVHSDKPEGNQRLTYVTMKGPSVTAVTVLVFDEPIDGIPCMHLGYAVREDERGKGVGKYLVTTAIEDFRAGMAPHGLKDFYVEAVVEKDNLASANLARTVLGHEENEITDDRTGAQSWQFLKRVQSSWLA